MAANLQSDYATTCSFRCENTGAIASAFERVLSIARELKLLREGLVGVDGTKVGANASKLNSLRYDRGSEPWEQLQVEIAALMEEAERADGEDADDGQTSPDEWKRRQRLKAKLDEACATLERCARR